MTQLGASCTNCTTGFYSVYCTKSDGPFRRQYLCCRKRGDRPGGCGCCPAGNILVSRIGSTDGGTVSST